MAKQQCEQEEQAYVQKRGKFDEPSNNLNEFENEIVKYVNCVKHTKIPPLCLPIYNDAKECLFQADNNLSSCQKPLIELQSCYSDPNKYKDFVNRGTEQQKQMNVYKFEGKNGGSYERRL